MQSVLITTDVVSSNSIRAMCNALCDKDCQWLAIGRRFSPGPPVSSTNKADRHDITKMLFKVALNTIEPTNQSINSAIVVFSEINKLAITLTQVNKL